MRIVAWVAIKIAIAAAVGAVADAASLETASAHSMQYYLSLPKAWSKGKSWPVVVVIESANRQFKVAAEAFEKARGDMPFILVTPLVTTNGGPRYREAGEYHYSDAVWNEIEHGDRCAYDFDGIAAAVADVRRRYGGEARYFVTGFEAGGHTLWAMIFRHPEAMRGAAPVATNYAGRCLDDAAFSSSPTRVDLAVRVFGGGSAEARWKEGTPLYSQTVNAKELAKMHGYRNVSDAVIPGKGHEPLADEVLSYFYSLWKAD